MSYSTDWLGECLADDDWDGMESLSGDGIVGLLMDFGSGTLTVFKNGQSLGVMKEGLSGAYSWFVCCNGSQGTIKIEREVPPSD